jgi:hypothetical protein
LLVCATDRLDRRDAAGVRRLRLAEACGIATISEAGIWILSLSAISVRLIVRTRCDRC